MTAVPTSSRLAIFREEQNFSWWVHTLILAACLLSLGAFRSQREALKGAVPGMRPLRVLEAPLYILVGVGIPAVMSVGFLHMTTEIAPATCQISYGWLPTSRHAIALSQVQHVEIVEYQAIREYGFWGARRRRDGNCAYTARGNLGVRLRMADGTHIVIGSQRPDELMRAINSERPVAA